MLVVVVVFVVVDCIVIDVCDWDLMLATVGPRQLSCIVWLSVVLQEDFHRRADRIV